MTLNDVLKARTVVSAVYREKMPVKLAYKFMKFLKITQKDEDFVNEKTREFIEEYGERDKDNQFVYTDNGGVKVKADKHEECVAKMTELRNTEVDDYEITFTVNELEDLKLSVEDITALSPFIVEE